MPLRSSVAVRRLGLKEGDELNVVAAGDSTVEVETKEMQRQRALGRDEANEQ